MGSKAVVCELRRTALRRSASLPVRPQPVVPAGAQPPRQNRCVPTLRLYPFRFRDPLTRKWVCARHKLQVPELQRAYAEWEIIGAPEVRHVTPVSTEAFSPFAASPATSSWPQLATAVLPRHRGLTMLEMAMVLAVIAVLAIIALPSFQNRIIREQIITALPLADIAKAPIALSWATAQTFPVDNAAAGLPPAEKIVNTYISAVSVNNGAIDITFGNSANGLIKGQILTLRPAVVTDAPIVPVAWVCGNADVPGGMTVIGENRTNIPVNYLPLSCFP